MSTAQARLQGEILKFIRDRRFERGERLFSEREFADKFSTTRAAVREAITTLEALRVVERRKQSGIYLRDLDAETSIEALVVEVNAGLFPTLKQIDEAVELRRVLEVGAVQYAATRRDDDDLSQIQHILDDSENRLLDGKSIIEEDLRFHKTIVTSTRNAVLVRVANWFYEFSKERRAHYFTDFEMSRSSHSEHMGIFAALQRGDRDECASLMDEHLSHTSQRWRAILGMRSEG